MRKFLETIKELILLFLLLGFGSAFIDYVRITSGSKPLFCIKNYDSYERKENFKGIFYRASRTVSSSPNEDLLDSSNISYQLFSIAIPTPSSFQYTHFNYQLVPHLEDSCSSSKLYFADTNTKVYLYCISSIDLEEIGNHKVEPFVNYLKKDGSLIEDFLVKTSFYGVTNNVLEYHSNHSDVIRSNITVFRCQGTNMNDIYIVPDGVGIQADFCTYKDDDYDMIWKILYEDKVDSDALEVIYEDEYVRYELPTGEKDKIFVFYPAVRGREEYKIPLMEAIHSGNYSMSSLIERGLKVEQTLKVNQ